ncbi:MAG: apolipoprotein N-acyltransferase [Saprospiraceae bacterium]
MKSIYKISILIFLFLVVAALSYSMVGRWLDEELWGYRPLPLFLSAWALIVLGTESFALKHSKKWRWLGLSTLSGVLLWLGFPTLPLPFIMFIAFIPLLIVEKEISAMRAGTNKWAVFKYSYHTFVVWNILTTYWVANTAFIASLVAIWLNSFFMTIPFILFHQTRRVLPKTVYLAFIAFWITFEYIHLNWEISWTWLNLGNSFASLPQLVQWYDYTGMFGGTLWILWMNVILLPLALAFLQKEKIKWTKWVSPILVLAIPILISLYKYNTYQEQGELVEVVTTQPTYEPHYEKFALPKSQQLAGLIELAESKITEQTQYLVFPETVVGAIEKDQLGKEPLTRRMREFVSTYPNLKLVTGITTYDFLEGTIKNQLPESARESKDRNGNVSYYEVYNSAIQIDNVNEEFPFYIKSKLVPGAEFLPYQQFFFWLEPLVHTLGGSLEGLGNQAEREVFASATGKIAPEICYESIYGEYTAGFVRNGAEAIFVMTNDGWWDNTAGHRQHLQFARLRAIETRRPVVRSANMGVSAFINQRGDIKQQGEYDQATALRDNVHFNQKLTFYTIWGDMIGRIGLFTAILLLMNTFVKTLTKKEESVD